MFNDDFYPTPKEVVDKMMSVVDIGNRTILEPSAGKGDILDAIAGKDNMGREGNSTVYMRDRQFYMLVKAMECGSDNGGLQQAFDLACLCDVFVFDRQDIKLENLHLFRVSVDYILDYREENEKVTIVLDK